MCRNIKRLRHPNHAPTDQVCVLAKMSRVFSKFCRILMGDYAGVAVRVGSSS
jgi:hypothetical protein